MEKEGRLPLSPPQYSYKPWMMMRACAPVFTGAQASRRHHDKKSRCSTKHYISRIFAGRLSRLSRAWKAAVCAIDEDAGASG